MDSKLRKEAIEQFDQAGNQTAKSRAISWNAIKRLTEKPLNSYTAKRLLACETKERGQSIGENA